MLKKLLLIIFALTTVAQAASFDADTALPLELKPLPQQSQAANLVAAVLTRDHYKVMPLDNAMAKKIFDQYLKSLDSERLFFVQSDVDKLAKVGGRLGNAIAGQDLNAAFVIFNRYLLRVSERFSYARELLGNGFDFGLNESYQSERKKVPWAKSETEMRELWRKRVKNDWLRLRLAGKDDKEIIETLDKRYEGFAKRIGRVSSEDAFQTFMNAYTMAIDPHTNYMAPRAAENFDLSMRLSLVGIGAVLQEKNDYTMIRELVPGGPAALSGQLQVGDRIVGVSQGQGGTLTDVLGWRLDDTVDLIRGAADSSVVLDVLPAASVPDGPHQLITLVRKKITLDEQAAKKSVISVAHGDVTYRVGIISLPTFYEDFEGRQSGMRDYKSATRDVARLLAELNDEKVDAVLIDLRNNGGGSLTEAIDLTGLFIGQGPVLQQRDATGAISVLSNTAKDIAWRGPLGVLINGGSASASEIFAAANQDYGRGLVIGERSFGKGTVQAVINLDRISNNDKPQFGELTFTVAQFFRINGGTTQLRGVTPDVTFPTRSDFEDLGESSYDNALPWTKIKPVSHAPAADLKRLKPMILSLDQARQNSDADFLCLKQESAEFEVQRKKNRVSLNETDRRQERARLETQMPSCEVRRNAGNGGNQGGTGDNPAVPPRKAPRDDGLQADERNLATELAGEQAAKDARDVYLDDAAHILGDETDLLNNQYRFARRAKASEG